MSAPRRSPNASSSIIPARELALLVAVSPFLGGCHAAMVGNLFVVGVAVAIFFGTLGLGRASAQGARQANRSAESSTDR